MELVKKNINGTEYTFANTTWSNSSGWGHETTLFKNNVEMNSRKVRYYNRTWECYEYQSCMLGCVSELIEQLLDELKNKFKEEKQITRLTKKSGHRSFFTLYIKVTHNHNDIFINLLQSLRLLI